MGIHIKMVGFIYIPNVSPNYMYKPVCDDASQNKSNPWIGTVASRVCRACHMGTRRSRLKMIATHEISSLNLQLRYELALVNRPIGRHYVATAEKECVVNPNPLCSRLFVPWRP
jgi:hypothetical protein